MGEFLTRLALSRPGIRFTSVIDGRVSFVLGKGSLRERAAALLGSSLADGLYPVEYAVGTFRLTGYVGRPEASRSSAGLMYTYINGRFIRDRVVQHAVLQAYRTLLERGRYPVVVLFLSLPPEEVDVNVHPTKHEVRFRNQAEVHDIILRGVESVLRGTPWLAGHTPDSGFPLPRGESLVSRDRRASVREALTAYRHSPAGERSLSPLPFTPQQATSSGVPTDMSVETLSVDLRRESGGFFGSLGIIGQFHGAYLLCQDHDALVIIDQHAAHERVAFEKLRSQFQDGKVASQRILFPEPIDFSFGEVATLDEHRLEISRLGFDLEPFGGSTWLLKEVPCLLAEGDYQQTLRDILEELRGMGRSRVFDDVAEGVLTTIACHSVVRGQRTLSLSEIGALLSQMDAVGFAANCPHGRPVYRKLMLGEIERMFRR